MRRTRPGDLIARAGHCGIKNLDLMLQGIQDMPASTAIRPWLLAGATALALPQAAHAQDNRQFQDWTVTCAQPDACVAASDGAGARLIVGPGMPDRRMRLVVLVAAETDENTPVAMRLDDGTTVQLAVNSCNATHCQAIVRPDIVPQVLDQMRGRRDAIVGYQSNGQVVLQSVSLMGLNAAVASLQ